MIMKETRKEKNTKRKLKFEDKNHSVEATQRENKLTEIKKINLM